MIPQKFQFHTFSFLMLMLGVMALAMLSIELAAFNDVAFCIY